MNPRPRLAVVVAVAVAGALVWMWSSRSLESPAAVAPERSNVVVPEPGFAGTVGSKARAEDLIATWFAYAVSPYAGNTPDPTAYRLVDSGVVTPLQTIGELVAADPAINQVVLDIDGQRLPLGAVELRSLLPTAVRGLLSERSTAAYQLHFRDTDTEQHLDGLLVDLHGRPFGPVDGSRFVLTLPRDFDGFALADGYIATRVRVPPAGAFVNADLRRAAFVTGRIGGARFTTATLSVHDEEPVRHPESSLILQLAPDGEFAFGPIAAGSKQLEVRSEDAWLAKPFRDVVLRPGRQDLGLLRLDPLHALHLRVLRGGRPFTGVLWVSHHLHDKELREFGAWRCTVTDGWLVLPRYPAVRVDVDAWTDDGDLGATTSDGLLAADTSAQRPALLGLEPAGTIVARLSTAPFDLPAGSRVLLCPNVHYLQRHARIPGAGVRPDERVCSAPVSADGRLVLEGVWPGRHELALVSPSGTILAATTLTLAPVAQVVVELAPTTALAAIEVGGGVEPPLRFALVSDRDGVVLRARTSSTNERFLVPAGAYHLHALDGERPGRIDDVTLAPGDVRVLLLRGR